MDGGTIVDEEKVESCPSSVLPSHLSFPQTILCLQSCPPAHLALEQQKPIPRFNQQFYPLLSLLLLLLLHPRILIILLHSDIHEPNEDDISHGSSYNSRWGKVLLYFPLLRQY
jgi:hypothetical protein